MKLSSLGMMAEKDHFDLDPFVSYSLIEIYFENEQGSVLNSRRSGSLKWGQIDWTHWAKAWMILPQQLLGNPFKISRTLCSNLMSLDPNRGIQFLLSHEKRGGRSGPLSTPCKDNIANFKLWWCWKYCNILRTQWFINNVPIIS